MYLAVSEWAISVVLFRCPLPKEQKPIYYVSRALADVETRYSKMELTALALRNLTGRMLQWAIELSEYGIEFQPKLSMKGQVMAEFVLEYSRRPIQCKEPSEKEWWTLRVDGASRSSGSGVGLLLQSPTGEHLEQAIRLGFPASNNEAEHVQKEYEAKDARMVQYLTKVRDTLQRFTEWTIEKIKRTKNGRADALAGITASLPIKEAILLPIHVQTNPSVAETSTCNTIEANQADDQEWTEDIIRYLRTSTLPEEPKQAHKIRVAHSQGYYWLMMKKDATTYVKKCDKCQRHALIPHMPSETLKPISGPWPFAQWGMDINSYSTPCYPQSNGQAEATNKTLIKALKKRLEQAKGKWVDELPGVLWAYQTTPGRPTGNTPFALAYGMDAIIPTEIGLPTIRTEAGRQDDANAELGRNLDWADEVRETASIRMADYQQRAAAHYNHKARPRSFKSGTLVLREVFENTAETGVGKFQANWEGPYVVSKTSESGAYHLQKLDETPLLRPWNVSNLK
ncbi:hypothetical protein CK203_052042 [Vitis vinifera]|uniref:Integrase zinc-binding domain-containing protein n=1 Tax=Vitis vinifera TaxID=29760 RepID=A0A438GR43_VITVI|nr:hypothetical protein CK203_052042 [Vitis vinifera]